MRPSILLLAAIVGIASTPVQAQSGDDEMALQRCVWMCLANSTGNADPAYDACVEKHCVAPAAGSQSGNQTDRQTVIFVQQSLADLGFDPGPVDGAYGSKTAAAVKAFRDSQGLDGSDNIDDDLVTALRSAKQGIEPAAAPDASQGVVDLDVSSSGSASARNLDVIIIEHASDGQMASCFTATVFGLKADGDGFLAVRSGPGSNYRKIDELHNGDVVTVYDTNGDWKGVMYGPSQGTCNYWEGEGKTRPLGYEGKKGWVHSDWLRVLAG
jgi:peptidoglycan hydrolase-like protein with peptidoglycan-binding domain